MPSLAPLTLLVGWGYSVVLFIVYFALYPPEPNAFTRMIAVADLVGKLGIYALCAYILASTHCRITYAWMLSFVAVVLMAGFECFYRGLAAAMDSGISQIPESIGMSIPVFAFFPLLGFLIGIVVEALHRLK